MELSLLNSENSLSQLDIEYEKSKQGFYRYLGLPENQNMDLSLPLDIAKLEIDRSVAMEMANKNRAKVLEFQQRRLQAEEAVAKARAENSVSINLRANFGLSQSTDNLQAAYTNPVDQQQVALTLSIPLVDWGVSSSRKKMAKADLV